jgi:YidC/Oxa1 family membrane protein insertase
MDKKNTTIGVLLLIAAFASMYLGQKYAPTPSAEPLPTVNKPVTESSAGGSATPETPMPGSTLSATTPFALTTKTPATGTTVKLENEFVAVNFTSFGGAVRDIAFKKYPAVKGQPEPYVFNALHADPMLAFIDFPGLDRTAAYEVVSQTPTQIVFRATFDGRVEVTRSYTLVAQPDKQHDPYVLRHQTSFRNLTDQVVPLPRVALSLGTSAPTTVKDDGIQITSGYSNGEDQDFIKRAELEGGSGFLGIGASQQKPIIVSPGPILWASISNKFFVSILTPDQPGGSMITRRVKLMPELSDADPKAYGLTGATQFDLTPLAANGQTQLAADFYVGPKEYRRLSNSDVFKLGQEKAMEFGFFKFFSQILLTLMTWIHGWFPNAEWAWGYAIVLTTLFLKIVFVPFTLAASRSAKRMQKIQPEMQAVREKFKDNPQKLQAATMELFKKHKVNPMGGCLPILITIPFFIGFFQMLQSTAELRFQPFLWATDLSAPDTIGYLPWLGLPINIMPILMGATMVIQMRLTPSPTMDNAQAKMMKFMPYIFALFCYTFSCALALYSTVNGIFTIAQQMVINRMKEPEPVAAAATVAPAGGKAMKNVTPKKKR